MRDEADRLLNQAGEAFRVSQYQVALDLWQSALEIYRDTGNRKGEASSLGNLGLTYGSLGEYQRAIDFQQQSLLIKREIGDRQGEANSIGNLCNAWKSQNRPEVAIVFYKDAVNMYKTIRKDITEFN